ncbi:FAD-dependent oxidoreductase [Babesia caballi]|uniref:FAD-dependent oxidoreductase n=1 Tax=Babesia caballi TaxID=5871 RepID=A0AAV4LU29_BABCB|nr:FAD-dependent oxidoreductase [Babesia caballi]
MLQKAATATTTFYYLAHLGGKHPHPVHTDNHVPELREALQHRHGGVTRNAALKQAPVVLNPEHVKHSLSLVSAAVREALGQLEAEHLDGELLLSHRAEKVDVAAAPALRARPVVAQVALGEEDGVARPSLLPQLLYARRLRITAVEVELVVRQRPRDDGLLEVLFRAVLKQLGGYRRVEAAVAQLLQRRQQKVPPREQPSRRRATQRTEGVAISRIFSPTSALEPATGLLRRRTRLISSCRATVDCGFFSLLVRLMLPRALGSPAPPLNYWGLSSSLRWLCFTSRRSRWDYRAKGGVFLLRRTFRGNRPIPHHLPASNGTLTLQGRATTAGATDVNITTISPQILTFSRTTGEQDTLDPATRHARLNTSGRAAAIVLAGNRLEQRVCFGAH